MHELALCHAVVDSVTGHARGRPLRRVDLRVGYLRQVVPDSLLFSWEVVTAGTDLAGCALVIEHVPAVVACRACAARTELDLPVLVCGTCAGHDVELLSGDELLVESIEVAVAVEGAG